MKQKNECNIVYIASSLEIKGNLPMFDVVKVAHYD